MVSGEWLGVRNEGLGVRNEGLGVREAGDDLQEEGAACLTVGETAEPRIFLGVVTIGEGEEAFALERLDLTVEIMAGVCLSDDMIQIVHR